MKWDGGNIYTTDILFHFLVLNEYCGLVESIIPLTLALSGAGSKSVAVLSIFRLMTSSITESDVFNFQRLSKFLNDPFFQSI